MASLGGQSLVTDFSTKFVEAIDYEMLNMWSYKTLTSVTPGMAMHIEVGFALNYSARILTQYSSSTFPDQDATGQCVEYELPALMPPVWLVTRAREFLSSFCTCSYHEDGMDVFEVNLNLPGSLPIILPYTSSLTGSLKADKDGGIRSQNTHLEVTAQNGVVYTVELDEDADSVSIGGPKSVDVPEGWGPCEHVPAPKFDVISKTLVFGGGATNEAVDLATSPMQGYNSMVSMSMASASSASEVMEGM